MCRFVAYHGPPIRLDELLYKPDHSIIHQSTDSREREEPLNGDGWGVGWYAPLDSPEPAVYREIRPAWSDENMMRVSPLVETPLYFAHVRAASPGIAVQQLNCHPFSGGRHPLEDRRDRDPIAEARRELMFMHNGALWAYDCVVRRLRDELEDDLYFGIRGSTDSEHAFAVIQAKLGDAVIAPTTADLAGAVREALEYLETLKHEAGGTDETTWANFYLTDGESVVATRYASPDDAPAQSLYVGEAGSFVADGRFTGTPSPEEGTDTTIVASEALFEDDRVWRAVPRNSIVTVAPDGETAIEPLDLDLPAA